MDEEACPTSDIIQEVKETLDKQEKKVEDQEVAAKQIEDSTKKPVPSDK